MPAFPAAAVLLAAATLALGPAAPLAAQATDSAGDPRAFRVGLRAGAGVPLGLFASTDAGGGLATPSFGFAGMATLRLQRLPVAVRGELAYDRFGVDLSPFADAGDVSGSWGVLSGLLNAVAELRAVGAVRPYVIGGAGVYRLEQKIIEDGTGTRLFGTSSTEPGLNGGGGLRFRVGRFDGFVEARYHTIFAADRLAYVPVAVGVEF